MDYECLELRWNLDALARSYLCVGQSTADAGRLKLLDQSTGVDRDLEILLVHVVFCMGMCVCVHSIYLRM